MSQLLQLVTIKKACAITGPSTSFFKQSIREKKLTRYKINTATLSACSNLRSLLSRKQIISMGETKKEIISRLKSIEAKLDRIMLHLESMPTSNDGKQRYGMDLAVEATGLSRSTIYNLVSARKFPHYKKGKRLFFKRKELEEWIDSFH